MTPQRITTRAALAVATSAITLTALVATAGAADAAASGGSCVGQLAATTGAGMAQIVHGWQDGQPNPPGFPIPGQYAANLAHATACPS